MSNLVQNIKIYDDIIIEYQDINAWTNEDCFPISQSNDEEKRSLRELNVIETLFPGVQGNRGDSKELFNRFNLFLHKYILSTDVPTYVFKAEHKEMQKSKIRSYKGILPSNLNKEEYIQREFDLPNNYSIITAIIQVTPENIQVLSDFIFDSTNSFVISSETNVFSSEFLSDIFKKHMIVKGATVINYLSLCLKYCSDVSSICRIGGDGGDQEVSLQIFSTKQQKERIVNKINQIL